MLPRPQVIRPLLILSLCLAMACGCGGGGGKKRPPLGKVSGKVLYKGNPVPEASVTFMTEGAPRAGTGTTNANGEFQLTTFDTNDGAIVGTHKVTITQQAASAKPMTPADLAANGPPPPPKGGNIPDKYKDIKTTPLTNTVDAGKNDITIELVD